jgi:hypothetical protein
MKNILKTVASYSAIGALAIMMGTAVIGCEKETVQGPAGAPGASGATGATGPQGETALPNPAMSEKSEKSTITTTANDVPGTGSSTTEKSSTKSTN